MKIQLVSDLHLEFDSIVITNNNGADVLLLAGDIMVAQDLHDHPETSYGMYSDVNLADLGRRQAVAMRFRTFLKNCSENFPHVIYIAGNHEFYHGKFFGGLDILREECGKFSNIYFLENECKIIDDVTFIGCTLWTDMNRGDPITLYTVTNAMNDYRVIRNDNLGYTKLRPSHTVERHRKSVEYIASVVKDKTDQKFVVVGHHAPTLMSCNSRYVDDKIMNGAYQSDLSNFILDNPQIKLWVHGHTHDTFDYMVGSTRIVCNPRGYSGYEDTGWDPNKILEIT